MSKLITDKMAQAALDMPTSEYSCPLPIVRNRKKFDKAFRDVMERGRKWKMPPLIHNGRKPR